MQSCFRDPQVLGKALMLGRQLKIASPQAVERASERRDLNLCAPGEFAQREAIAPGRLEILVAGREFALRLVKSALSGSEFVLRLIEGLLKVLQLLLRRLKRAPRSVKFSKMFRTEASAPFGQNALPVRR